MDVRIGVINAPRELTIEMQDDDRPATKEKIDAAFSSGTDVLWLTDRRGREVAVPSDKIAYVDLGHDDGDRRIGFGG